MNPWLHEFIKYLEEKKYRIHFCVFSVRMQARSTTDNNLLFEEYDSLSAPLISGISRTSSAAPTCVYVTIGSDKCFKLFENRFARGLGNARLSEVMDEIRGTSVFHDLLKISFDNSGTLSEKDRKEKFFFGHPKNLQIVWEYCMLSKIDIEVSPGLLDEGDTMRIEDFNSLMDFYLIHNTLQVSQENMIMEVFSYFVNRDMILEASTMQLHQEDVDVNTLVDDVEEEAKEMETESFLHDNLDFDILSNAEVFYKRYEGTEPKDVWTSFDIFETNSIDMAKLDNLIFQKSKDFYTLEKRRGSSIRCLGLIFTEEDVKTNWANRRLEDLKIKLPTNFEELEQYKDGHLLECFLNLDKDAINYETKALHFSAHMFFEKPGVKKAIFHLVKQFALKNASESRKTQRLHTILSKKEMINLSLKMKLVKLD